MNLSPAISEGRQVASKTHGRDHPLEEGAMPSCGWAAVGRKGQL